MQEQDPAGRRPARLPAEASLSSWLTMFVCSTHRPTCTTLSLSHVSLLYSCVRATCPSALSSYHSKRIPNNPAKKYCNWRPLGPSSQTVTRFTLCWNVDLFWKCATLFFRSKELSPYHWHLYRHSLSPRNCAAWLVVVIVIELMHGIQGTEREHVLARKLCVFVFAF